MGTFLYLQNRALPPEQGGGRVVYAWPADAPEAFCDSADPAFTDSAHRVIVVGTGRCAMHVLKDDPCPQAFRVPAECPHERLDPAADPAHPRCLTCGLVGTDGTARWLNFMNVPPAGPDDQNDAWLDGDVAPPGDPSSESTPEAS